VVRGRDAPAWQRDADGVEYAWDLDGDPQDGLGDLYRYTYAPSHEGTLCARFGALEANAVIHGSEGTVSSTNNLSCAVGVVGAATNGGPWWVATLFVLAMRRRRPVV